MRRHRTRINFESKISALEDKFVPSRLVLQLLQRDNDDDDDEYSRQHFGTEKTFCSHKFLMFSTTTI